MWKFTRYLYMMVTNVPVMLTWVVILRNFKAYHDVQQKWMVINNSCCTGLIPLMQRRVVLQNLKWLQG